MENKKDLTNKLPLVLFGNLNDAKICVEKKILKGIPEKEAVKEAFIRNFLEGSQDPSYKKYHLEILGELERYSQDKDNFVHYNSPCYGSSNLECFEFFAEVPSESRLYDKENALYE